MRYTVLCPCHDKACEIETGPDGAVTIGDQMTCTYCSCIHRVADVEPGELVGAVRLARLSRDELVEAYRELGMAFVAVACPACGEECTALGRIDPDPDTSGVLFCEHCRLPMIVEGDTAREPDAIESAQIIRMALGEAAPRNPFTGL